MPGALERRGAAALTLRAPVPGDLGWIVERHGALYAEEYGWDGSFETLVAGIVAASRADHDAERERAWIADLGGERAGCVLCVAADDPSGTAQAAAAAGRAVGARRGVGGALVDACLAFARERGLRAQ